MGSPTAYYGDMDKYQCSVCGEALNGIDDFTEHLRDEFEEHQTLADMAADELRELGAEL